MPENRPQHQTRSEYQKSQRYRGFFSKLNIKKLFQKKAARPEPTAEFVTNDTQADLVEEKVKSLKHKLNLGILICLGLLVVVIAILFLVK